MATLPAEQVTQRNKTADVSIVSGYQNDAPGEKLWLSTTTLPYTVVNTKSVVSNQQDRDELEARIVAAGEAAYTDLDLYGEGIGFKDGTEPLVVLGDGTEALAVANDATGTIDIDDYVNGGYKPLTFEIDSEATIDNGTATMLGSVLQYVGSETDGSDTVPVIVTDREGNTVTVTVTVTVA
jgi:hypothetical protein